MYATGLAAAIPHSRSLHNGFTLGFLGSRDLKQESAEVSPEIAGGIMLRVNRSELISVAQRQRKTVVIVLHPEERIRTREILLLSRLLHLISKL